MSRSLLCLILALCAPACRRSEPPGDAAAPAATATAVSSDAALVERLRSLGYVGFVPAASDDHGSGVVVNDRQLSYPGYSLFTNSNLCSAVLIDEAGAVKNYWRIDGCARWFNAELLESGELVVVGSEAGEDSDDLGRRFLLKLSWKGDPVWKHAYPGHHDIEPTPSGNLLTLAIHPRMIPEIDPSMPVRDNRIVLLSPDGLEFESCSLYDLFQAAPNLVTLQPIKRQHSHKIDLFHANSVQWIDPATSVFPAPSGNPHILVSVRHQDAVVMVDWKEKRLVWAWGQGEISSPHHATMLPSGNILLFDNGLSRGWSRVVELDPRTRNIVWRYEAPVREKFFTISRGSNQRLANGNTLIAESDRGHAFEVTPAGQVVWEFWNPFHNEDGRRATIVRIKRYERSRIDALVRTLGEGRRNAAD